MLAGSGATVALGSSQPLIRRSVLRPFGLSAAVVLPPSLQVPLADSA